MLIKTAQKLKNNDIKEIMEIQRVMNEAVVANSDTIYR